MFLYRESMGVHIVNLQKELLNLIKFGLKQPLYIVEVWLNGFSVRSEL